MRFFSTFLPAIGIALLGAVGVLAQNESPVAIIEGITEVTQASMELRVVVESITPRNVVTQGAKVGPGLNQIGQTVTTLTQEITQGGYTPFPDDEAKEIVDVLTTFVEVHQALLNVIIGKHGILQSTPFTAPIGAVLRALEGVVDNFAFIIIALIPTQEGSAQDQINALGETFTRAINTYS